MTKKKKTTALAKREAAALAPLIEDDLAYAAELASHDTADATKVAYDNDWKSWTEYAVGHDLEVFPVGAGSLAAFIGHLAKTGYKVSTIRRRCAAIAHRHKTTKADGEFYVSPTEHHTIRRLMQGLVRKHGAAPDKKAALTVPMVRSMVQIIDNELAHFNFSLEPDEENERVSRLIRDRTLLLVGFITGMRRSELEHLEWEHVESTADGMILAIPHSKTDQANEGQFVAIPELPDGDKSLCPVAALRGWEKYLEVQGDDSAYVFNCSGKTIHRVVQRHVKKVIGDDYVDYGAHSFRSGYVTEAHRAGGRLEDIMMQTRHVSREVAQGYIRKTELSQNKATVDLLHRLRGKGD